MGIIMILKLIITISSYGNGLFYLPELEYSCYRKADNQNIMSITEHTTTASTEPTIITFSVWRISAL